MVAASSVTGVTLAAALVSPALAWHPKGMIIKSVQNVTANGQLSDANDAASAISAKPGDTLKYVIKVSNTGAGATNGSNDMAFTSVTDTLDANLELVSDPTLHQIKEDFGTIKPGQNVTREYLVKVKATATKDVVIENKACFTGNSIVKDNPQQGCDVADIKIMIPTPAPKPTPTPISTTTPSPTPKPTIATAAAPASTTTLQAVTPAASVLPATGPANFIIPAVLVSVLGYAGNMLRLKRRVVQAN